MNKTGKSNSKDATKQFNHTQTKTFIEEGEAIPERRPMCKRYSPNKSNVLRCLEYIIRI